MTARRIRTAWAVHLTLPLLFFAPAHGADNLDSVAMSPVIVTATRFLSSPQEQPLAAQIITADDIRASSAGTVAEVLSKLGGVHTRINFTGVPDAPLDLRGFGVTGDQNTLLLLNGQRISENEGAAARLSAIPLDAIERIEILRGAGAVLYGGGATGGTINIITRSPVSTGTNGHASLIAGSHGLRDARGSIETGQEHWGLNLSAQRYENDNYRDNNRTTQRAANAELRLRKDSDFLAFGFLGDEQSARLPGARTEDELDSDPRGATTPDDYLNSQSTHFIARGEKHLGNVILALDMGRRNKHAHGVIFSGPPSDTDVETRTFSPRMLWKSEAAGIENRLTVGLDWSVWTYETDVFGRDENGTQNNRAVYLRDEMLFSTGTRLSFGVRRERVEQTQEEKLTPLPEERARHMLTANELALQQTLDAGFEAYGRTGRSFRIANVDETRCWFAPCPALLKPQRSQDRELGLQWRGQHASARVSAFEMLIDDEIHYNALTFANMNLSPTRRRGVELEGALRIARKFDLAARYTRTEATFREGVYGGVDVKNNEVPLVPRDRASLGLGWQISAATRLGLNVLYVGPQRYDNDQANRFRRMPDYAVTDVKVSHETGAWRLTAGINNLFDQAYYSYGIVNGSATSFNAYPEDRRNLYASAEYRF